MVHTLVCVVVECVGVEEHRSQIVLWFSYPFIHSIHPRGPWPLTRAAEKEEDVVSVDMVARCRTCC